MQLWVFEGEKSWDLVERVQGLKRGEFSSNRKDRNSGAKLILGRGSRKGKVTDGEANNNKWAVN